VLRVIETALRMKAQVDSAAKVGKILFVGKRRERLYSGECRGTQKLVVPWVRMGSGVL
jgi:hypothetical protein